MATVRPPKAGPYYQFGRKMDDAESEKTKSINKSIIFILDQLKIIIIMCMVTECHASHASLNSTPHHTTVSVDLSVSIFFIFHFSFSLELKPNTLFFFF
ncbi:hypothetical protein RIF29_39778 [Crotalaria pallida]|uniref:Uncharacterized protein n=1 Tax=Crotalaria pallida TaxID=3830 RepID=A0AAN9HPX4_CROPI